MVAGTRQRRWRAALLVAGFTALGLIALLRPWDWPRRTDPDPPPAVEPEPFVTNSIGMKLKRIPPGKFLMGTAPSGPSTPKDEVPCHEVELTDAFYMGVHEVTQQEFEEVMGYNPSYFCAKGEGKEKVKGLQTSRFPVDSVTWEDAQEFCAKLSAVPAEQQTGRTYRLPTEAEWEYACRAGTTTTYHFGDASQNLKHYAWYADSADGSTHPVGLKKANPWGLYDMYGNVWEWCADYYQGEYYHTSPSKNPRCTQPMVHRVLRGGGWGRFGSAWFCRSAARGQNVPTIAQNYNGLRVVFTAPAPGS
jgi:formylglycine-generating enzyme required for sulfatase activity